MLKNHDLIIFFYQALRTRYKIRESLQKTTIRTIPINRKSINPVETPMNKRTFSTFLFTLFLTIGYSQLAQAQTAGQNISAVNVETISDEQITQLMQQAEASGLTDTQLIQLAQSKGLSGSQIQQLQSRMAASDRTKGQVTGQAQQIPGDKSRRLNYKPDVMSAGKQLPTKSRIFGSEIFDSSNKTFEPNLKIATPLNYVLGPEDQLNINVYGNNIVNWKVEITPEGDINIPGIGVINLAGKTIEQATAQIKTRLVANRYNLGKGTSVQVTLGNIRSIKVIIIGQVVKPGTFTLPSLATAFNALYAAGGSTENGSLRQIEIIRNNRIIRHLDIYDFLLKGDQQNNIMLRDQDIIRVPTYRTRVELEGKVKIPALFEVLPGENLEKVLAFAGGFSDEAYTARIKVSQISDQQRKITDVFEADYANYQPLRGDKYTVDSIINRYENKVVITGAVFKPGEYELGNGMSLYNLIKKAAGLKEDAFTERGTITRLKPDNSIEILGFNLASIIDQSESILLKREDIIAITSKFDLKDKYAVSINGNVRAPGSFTYGENLKLEDLIVKAGGFGEGASTNRIEVARRVSDSDPNSESSIVSNIFTVNIEGPLKPGEADFQLRPFDIVSVYNLPGYKKQRTVKIEGEVLYPGTYTLKFRNEKISDLIKRAGGITKGANIKGGSLKRDYLAILGIDKEKTDAATLVSEHDREEIRLKKSYRDSSSEKSSEQRNNYVGINLNKILAFPGSKIDVLLEDGDIIRIPKAEQIVRINGQVLLPSAIIYDSSKSFNDFISGAGGYTPQALKKRAYIIYANGAVKSTRKFFFITNHPTVEPGSEIFVPKKEEQKGNTMQSVLGYTTGFASLAAIIFGILSLHK